MIPAAFFDLDGTLLARPSLERRFLRFLLRRRELGLKQGLHWLMNCFCESATDFRGAITGNKGYLTDVPAITAEEWAENLREEPLLFYDEGLGRVEWHAAQGHRIFLVSGTLAPLARTAATFLPGPLEVCATELECNGGRWTGQIKSNWLSGEAKAHAVARLAAKYNLDLPRSFAYGDSIADLPMLKAAGKAIAVNPSFRLERVARRRRWPILKWQASTRLAAQVRQFILHATPNPPALWR